MVEVQAVLTDHTLRCEMFARGICQMSRVLKLHNCQVTYCLLQVITSLDITVDLYVVTIEFLILMTGRVVTPLLL